MSSAWLEWLNALLRWIHVIAGILWIGDSLLFMWIDRHLHRDPQSRKDVDGVTWLLHSGGYYQLEKRALIPGRVPPYLRWFWLEATTTWLSGFLLLIVVYYLSAAALMVDPAVRQLTPGQSVAAGLGLLLAGWLMYDGLWQSALTRWPGVAAGVSLALLVVVNYLITHLLSARAAFLHVGAMAGTIMAANVWIHIMLPQRQMMRAAREGREIDASLSLHAKTRSAHNSYLTFPVIFLMISNHFPGIYGAPLPWIVLTLIFVFGAGVRHLMLVEMKAAWGTVLGTAAAAVALVVLTVPRATAPSISRSTGATPVPSFAQVRTIIVQRCAICHSETPIDPDFASPAGGVQFDTPQQIRARADRIKERAVVLKTMPLANKTGITDDDRDILGRWVDAGAPLK